MKIHSAIRRSLLPLALLFCLMPVVVSGDTPKSQPQPQMPPAAVNPHGNPATGVSGADATMTDIHDIKPVVIPKGFPTRYIWIAMAALLLLILLFLGRHFWKKRKGEGEIPILTPELPPEENARLALNALAAERYVDGRRFYFRLSEILRRYLSERYAIGAPEMTPEELHPLVARLKLPTGQRAVLTRFWSRSEPVKFAGQAAQETDMAVDLEQVRSFVETTTAAMSGPPEADPPSNLREG